ncbi:TetR/AcrR family transcriptional regulator [Mycoplasma sp. P36-A1]|uniref:TetR/AcrR family transcriptional regulator n=1 Tax=Mycoplasma sp. P36-A1 TaxID=3252900 RepID=UPI003C2C22F7
MKYDLSKKPTKGAMRTLDALSCAMFTLLSKKGFEDITVNEICDMTSYPRATFYNYFDDKFDLLNYCWHILDQQIHLEEYEKMDPRESLYIYFDRIYDVVESSNEIIKKILSNNTESGYMFNSFKIYMNAKVRETFQKCSLTPHYQIPSEIVSDHYSNTLLLILEWVFWKKEHCDKESAHKYLKYLLDGLSIQTDKKTSWALIEPGGQQDFENKQIHHLYFECIRESKKNAKIALTNTQFKQ